MNLFRSKLAFGLGLLGTLFIFGACKPADDPCSGEVCDRGACVAGECVCNEGFEGMVCDVEMRSKFIRGWEGGDICLSGSFLYGIDILPGEGIREVLITNMFQTEDTVSAIVSGNDLIIGIQAFGQWTIQGSGRVDTTASPDALSIDYSVDYGGGLKENCLLNMEPR